MNPLSTWLSAAILAVLPEAWAHVQRCALDWLRRSRSADPSSLKPQASSLPGEAKAPRLPTVKGTTAVVRVSGLIVPNEDWAGWDSTPLDSFDATLRALAGDEKIGQVILTFDSPGGVVYGVPESAAAIRALREKKPVYGIADPEAASAAYWLAAQCTKLYTTPSGQVGSIGVWSAHTDFSGLYEQMGLKITAVSAGKNKTEGNPWEPLSDEARAEMQAGVDYYYELFTRDVAAGRGAKLSDVKGEAWGQGRMLRAEDAKRAGLVDGICTLDELLVSAGARPRGVAAADVAIAQLALG